MAGVRSVVEGMSFSSDELVFMTETERYDAFLRLYRSASPEDAASFERLCASPDAAVALIFLRYLEDLPERRAAQTVVRLIERENEIVSRAAMAAYLRSHYPGKARLLKQLVLSKNASACRFAVRTLSRAGFMEILPLVLRELPEREGAVRMEMIEALRFLPDRRSVPSLVRLAVSPEEPTRFLVMQVLAELQARTRALPLRFFLKRAQDPSERVRRAAIEALQRFPSQRVAPLIMQAALDESEPEQARARAVRAMAAFPDERYVRPLAALSAYGTTTELRLAAEISLRAVPARSLKSALLPLLKDRDPRLARQAAILTADLLGAEPEAERVLLSLWNEASDEERLSLADPLRGLGTPAAESALVAAATSGALSAYAAAAALSQLRGPGRAPAALAVLLSPASTPLVRQCVLDRFARRGPDAEVREALLPALVSALEDPNDNIRYGAVKALGWYPLSDTLAPFVDLLAREDHRDVVRAVSLLLAKSLGRDPVAFARAAAAHARRPRFVPRVVRIIASQGWDPSSADALLDELANPPSGLLADRPAELFAVLVHLLEHGSVGLIRLWPLIGDGERLARFLRMLGAALRSPKRRFPGLALDELSARMTRVDAPTRGLYYEVLAADGRNEAVERLAEALLDEADETARAKGRALLRACLEGGRP